MKFEYWSTLPACVCLRKVRNNRLRDNGWYRDRKWFGPGALFTKKVKSSQRQAKRYSICRLRKQTTDKRNAEFIYDTIRSRSRSDDSTWLSFCVVTFAQTKCPCNTRSKWKTVSRNHKKSLREICAYVRFYETKGETIARSVHCLVCRLHHENEHRHAFMATNELSSF